jgi:two-component system, LytTR family, sensor histidine kinase AgrC
MMSVSTNFSAEQLTVLSTQIVFIYSVYRFLGGFFDRTTAKNKLTEFLSYIFFFILNIVTYIFLPLPILFFLLNVISVFLITFNYEGTLIQRIIAPLMAYGLGGLLEILLFGMSMKIHLFQTPTGTMSIMGILLNRILFLSISVTIERLRNLRLGEKVPKLYWITIIILPFFSFSIAYIINRTNITTNAFTIIIMLLFIGDILLFFLFDHMIALQGESERILLYDLQNDSYRRQLSIMNESLQTTQMMRHDIKNQMLMVQGLLEKNDVTAAREHLRKMTGIYLNAEKNITTGNIEIDSLINFKLTEAEQKQIKITHSIQIPEQLGISSFDMATIIGNLFDNAFDALEKLPEYEKILDINLRYSRGRLFITFVNSYTGTVCWKNGVLATQKEDKHLHGIGLSNVALTAERYNGQIDITTDNSLFKVTVLLYTETKK